mmetsp:Transcript_29391/g.54536  ORF Transcript_29391/g.54536 Transcript_29391/m.54536 type:complete len:228 (-) Transcript_29391:748-1431(-)
MEKQLSLLSSRPNVIVATPGRLAHHLSEIPTFSLQRTEVLFLDKADRLFELGFAEQMRTICSSMPSPERGRQTLLFSATMPKVLVEFTRSGTMGTEPDVVRLDEEATVSGELNIWFVTCRSEDREAVLLHLLRDVLPGSGTAATMKEERDKKKKGKKGKKKKKDKGKGEAVRPLVRTVGAGRTGRVRVGAGGCGGGAVHVLVPGEEVERGKGRGCQKKARRQQQEGR